MLTSTCRAMGRSVSRSPVAAGMRERDRTIGEVGIRRRNMKRGQLFSTQHLHLVVSIALIGLMVEQGSRAGTPGEWVGTWYAPPVTTSTLTFNDQTIREIVHVSIPGTRIQVRLTNLFGTGLLAVGEVHVAIRATGSSIVPGTDRLLTFGGATSVNIPAGAPMLSDPVDLETGI